MIKFLGAAILLFALLINGFSQSTKVKFEVKQSVIQDYHGVKNIEPNKPGVTRSKAVVLKNDEFVELENNFAHKKSSDKNRITLSLFDSKTYTANIESIEEVYYGSEPTISYQGIIEGDEESSVTLVRTGKIFSGSINLKNQAYKIQHIDGEIHRLNEMDYSQMPKCHPPLIPAENLNKSTNADPEIKEDSGNTIDVMVVYTPAARSAEGGTTGMENMLALAITESNTGYSQSGVTQRLRLVNTYEVDYTEAASWSTMLDNLRGTSDGNMDEIHDLRDIYGADHVVLIIDDNDYCGLAYMMNSVSSGFASWAFAVVDHSCATGYYSFAHELGHNMGCDHDEDNDNSKGGAYIYSNGYQSLDASPKCRSIMAYNDGCSCTRVNYWSNPDININGQPFGVHHDSVHSADNRMTLNNTLSTTQNFRQAKSDLIVVEETNEVTDGETINLGNVTVGSSLTRTFKITNLSGSSVSISGVALGNTTDFTLTSSPSSSVASGASTLFSIRFDPSENGSKNSSVNIQSGLLSFTISGSGVTSTNNAPYTPSNPSPSDMATNVDIDANLDWNGGDPDGDPLTYTVKFGTYSPPPTIGTTTNISNYNLPTLESATHYYWQIISDDGEDSKSGDVWEFSTETVITPPDISTVTANSITSSSARCYGRIDNSNGNTIDEVGICYNSTGNVPSINDDIAWSSAVTTNFFGDPEDLEPFTTYYYKAFANYDESTSYGNTKSFKTSAALPVIGVATNDTITETTAKINSSIEAINDAQILYAGIAYASESGFDPATEATVLQDTVNWITTGPFSVRLSELNPGSNYYYKLFIENSVGKVYTDEKMFTTLSSAPIVDLDSDNSEASGYNFNMLFTEGQNCTPIADSDATITDSDLSDIDRLHVVLKNPQDGILEQLNCNSSHENISVNGNQSDSITLINNGGAEIADFVAILKSICYENNSENPGMVSREIGVIAKDETAYGPEAICTIEVTAINDAPVNTQSPYLSGEFEIGGTLYAHKGAWNDLLDGGNTNLTFDITWQRSSSESSDPAFIETIKSGSDTTYIVQESDFSKWFRVKITASDDGVGEPASESTIAYSDWYEVGKENQSIEFLALENKTYGDDTFELSATATSGLPVSFYSENDEIASIEGNVVTINGAGTVKIWARQGGNEDFYAAPPVDQTLTIAKAMQTVSFQELESKIYGNEDFMLSASSTSGLEVLFFVEDTEIATVSEGLISINGAGTTPIGAYQPGSENYLSSDTVYQELLVEKATQTITQFQSIGNKTFGDADFLLEATASSGLTVSFESANVNIVTIEGNTASIMGAGEVQISAYNIGSDNYLPSDTLTQVIEIEKADQVITFTALEDIRYDEATFELSASSTSGLAVSFSSLNTNIVEITDSEAKLNGVGQVTIEASQSGNNNYKPAATIQQPLNVLKGNQQVSIDPFDQKHFGDDAFEVTGLSSSGLPVLFESSDEAICKIDNNILTIVNPGTCQIIGVQSGNELYNEARSELEIEILKGIQTASEFNAPSNLRYGDNPFTISAELNSGLTPIIGSTNHAILSIENLTATIHSVGTVDVFAYHPGNSQWQEIDTIYWSIEVDKGEQFINFDNILNKKYGEPPFQLIASSSSDLPVEFFTLDTTIIEIDGSMATIIGTGNAYIYAKQDGNDLWEEASKQRKSVYINKGDQTLELQLNDTIFYTTNDIDLVATSSAGLTVGSFESSDLSIAEVAGDKMRIKNQGQTTITAIQNGNEFYSRATTSKTISVVFPTGWGNVSDGEIEFTAYPNPSNNLVNYECSEGEKGNIKIFNQIGKKVYDAPALSHGQINISNWSSGIYTILFIKGKQIKRQQLIKP